MNVNFLLSHFFKYTEPAIEVFDKDSIYPSYFQLQERLLGMPNIERSVLQALAYCFYEIMDNVLDHSGKQNGVVIMEYDDEQKRIRVLVADEGIGVRASLSQNPEFAEVTEEDALKSCIEDRVTSGSGMGFGLFCTARLVKFAGTRLLIHSGNHFLRYENGESNVERNGFWQGTIIFLELVSDKEINPNSVVDNRTDVISQYNETFLENQDTFDKLW